MRMAMKAGTGFDRVVGLILNFTYAVPPLVLGIYLMTVFAGKLDWFPIGSLKADNYDELSAWGQIIDRAHHFVLPLICYMIGGFTQLSYLMRNSMLEVVKSDYVRTARAKGVTERVVLYKHALRNALIALVPGIAGFFGVFLTGSLIIERMFNLDGMGLLSYQSLIVRDYNVIMGITFISSLILVIGRVFSDIVYVLIDPRIDFK
jgi:microcin C transport system permease protein